jgi:hypothetical protein
MCLASADFCSEVVGLRVTRADPDHVVLESESCPLVVHAVPGDIAASIEVATPPIRRGDASVKLVFTGPSLGKARASAARHGGALDPAAREWQFQGQRVCDGRDPEGNVIQLRAVAL